MSTNLFNIDNMTFETDTKYDIIYCDYIYENLNFSWAEKFWPMLKENGIFIAQCDWHSEHRFRIFMEDVLRAEFVNHLVNKCEWGNHPKNRFHQCYDDIIIYSNGKSWFFDPSKIQVPKKTLTKGLNPSGRETKQATAWIDDITLTTTAKERVRKADGHLVRWQKPLKLFDRIVEPFVNNAIVPEAIKIFDPFAGVASLGVWCAEKGYDYTGIELDEEIWDLAVGNLFPKMTLVLS